MQLLFHCTPVHIIGVHRLLAEGLDAVLSEHWRLFASIVADLEAKTNETRSVCDNAQTGRSSVGNLNQACMLLGRSTNVSSAPTARHIPLAYYHQALCV